MEAQTITGMPKPITGGFARGLNHQRKLAQYAKTIEAKTIPPISLQKGLKHQKELARSVKMIEAKTIPMGLQRGLAYKKILSEQVADLAKSLNIPAAGSVKNFNILNLFKILR